MIEPSVLAAFMAAAPAQRPASPNAGSTQVWTLPGLPQAARLARELARAASVTRYQAEAAALCASELVTNALLHSRSGRAGGTVTVTIGPAAEPGELRISVGDDGNRLGLAPECCPPLTDGPLTPEHGYGLAIVDAVATVWGRSICPDGWTTWCEIPTGDEV